MKLFTQVFSGLDVSAINSELAASPHLWDQFTIRKVAQGSPHTRMSDIWIRYNDITPFAATGNYSRLNDPHIPVFYPGWHSLPSLHKVTYDLMRAVDGQMLGGILITRIPPGAGIDPHTDAGWHVDFYDKFYLSLQSAPGAKFCSGDEVLEPAPGDIWRFDNRLPHWVANDSTQDRVTAIICIRTDRFTRHP